jgi:hypothetical protein
MRLALMPVFVLAAMISAQARLGETLDQLVARYGTPGNAGGPHGTVVSIETKMFHKGNWIITVQLINGISVGEKYQKPGGPNADDIATLLSINSEGHT